jgi:hypothetical protein
MIKVISEYTIINNTMSMKIYSKGDKSTTEVENATANLAIAMSKKAANENNISILDDDIKNILQSIGEK